MSIKSFKDLSGKNRKREMYINPPLNRNITQGELNLTNKFINQYFF
jgi:hypothetical protein